MNREPGEDPLAWASVPERHSDVNVGIQSLHMDERGVHLGDGPLPPQLIPLSAE